MVNTPLEIGLSIYVGVSLVFIMVLLVMLTHKSDEANQTAQTAQTAGTSRSSQISRSGHIQREQFCNCRGAGVMVHEDRPKLLQQYRDGILTENTAHRRADYGRKGWYGGTLSGIGVTE